jgi:hypothetical protein
MISGQRIDATFIKISGTLPISNSHFPFCFVCRLLAQKVLLGFKMDGKN